MMDKLVTGLVCPSLSVADVGVVMCMAWVGFIGLWLSEIAG
jgi:hypothetical protein